MYQYEKQSTLRMAPKLREAHVNPNNCQRMKVRLASQVLSRTVSAGTFRRVIMQYLFYINTKLNYLSISIYLALHALAENGVLSEEAKNTALFCRMANDLFDVLNSSTLHSPDHKRPITFNNMARKLQEISKYESWIESWTFFDPVKQKSFRYIPFKQGLLVTLSNFKKITKRLIEDLGFKFICTRRFNQDGLEVYLLFTNFMNVFFFEGISERAKFWKIVSRNKTVVNLKKE